MEEKIFHTIIKEICKEEKIEIQLLSYDWIIQLKKNGKVRHITGNRFDLNPEATGDIACDKYATYEVLKSQNVPVIGHHMLFNPLRREKYIQEEGVYLDVINYFKKNKNCLVVKPNSGCQGNGVTLCRTFKELDTAIAKLFKTSGSLSLCPYYEIQTEYRSFYLNGEILLIYGKTKPFVIGDGVSNITELIKSERLELPDNKIVESNLQKIDLEYIPKLNEKYNISWKHNLSGGAKPKILEDNLLKERIEKLVKKAGKAMNINFATIDIAHTVDDELLVLEVNSGVCMSKFIEEVENGYDIAKKIYRKAVLDLFKN